MPETDLIGEVRFGESGTRGAAGGGGEGGPFRFGGAVWSGGGGGGGGGGGDGVAVERSSMECGGSSVPREWVEEVVDFMVFSAASVELRRRREAAWRKRDCVGAPDVAAA